MPNHISKYGGMMMMDVALAFVCILFIYQFLYPEKRRKPYHRVSVVFTIFTLAFFILHFF